MFEAYPPQQTYGYSSKHRKRSPSREGENFNKRSRDNDYGRRGGYHNNRRDDRDYYSRDNESYGTTIIDPFKVDYLVSFNQFCDHLSRKGTRHISQDESEKRYETYKENFTKKQYEKFFNKYKNSEWFLEKYHVQDSIPIKEHIKSRRLEFLEKYIQDLSLGKYDSIDFSDKSHSSSSSTTIVPASTKESVSGDGENPSVQEEQEEQQVKEDESKAPSEVEPKESCVTDMVVDEEDIKGLPLNEYALDLNSFAQSSLFIKSLPEFTKRQDVLKLCENLVGFKYLVFSDPRPDKRMSRLGWIVFEEGTDLENAIKEIDGVDSGDFIMHLAMNQSYPIRVKVLNSEFSVKERIEKDLEQAKSLAESLDKECDFSGYNKIEEHLALLDANASEDTEDEQVQLKKLKRKLDLSVHYLLKVHQYDYYGGVEASSPEDLNRRICIYHRRHLAQGSDKPSSTDVSAKLDVRIQLRISKPVQGDNESFVKMGGRNLEEHMETSLSRRIKKESEGKYRCVECEKLFKGEEFVKKHLKTKHEDIIASITTDTLLFNSFLLNPCKVDSFRPPPVSNHPSYSRGGSRQQYSRDREYNREPRVRESRMPPPPRSGRSDPRQIRSYQDLDAPVDGDIQLQYD